MTASALPRPRSIRLVPSNVFLNPSTALLQLPSALDALRCSQQTALQHYNAMTLVSAVAPRHKRRGRAENSFPSRRYDCSCDAASGVEPRYRCSKQGKAQALVWQEFLTSSHMASRFRARFCFTSSTGSVAC